MSETMNLTQMLAYTGYSRVKLTSDKNIRALAEAGANVEGTGKDWQVTVAHLVEADLVNNDGTPFEVARRTRSKNSAVSSRKTKFPEIEKSDDLTWLKGELDAAEKVALDTGKELSSIEKKLQEMTELGQQRRELQTRQADATARAAAARKRFDAIAATVAAEAERLRKNMELLESLRK